ncbi:MAG: hypothetical protein V7L02_12045, partial [Nostoc sp.]|uniref:hypothetical protein n=1 Tax=Nostoc sp. TaxID=1180 RepID=UPI002FFB72C4
VQKVEAQFLDVTFIFLLLINTESFSQVQDMSTLACNLDASTCQNEFTLCLTYAVCNFLSNLTPNTFPTSVGQGGFIRKKKNT